MVPRRPDACYGGGIHRFLLITFIFSFYHLFFFNFSHWGIVSFTFHCQLSSRFVYNLKRTRLYGKLVNNITVWEFDCLSNAVGNEKIEKYFTKFFVNLTKLLKLKPRYAGNPRKMPETVSSGEDSFASRYRLTHNEIDWDGNQDDIDWYGDQDDIDWDGNSFDGQETVLIALQCFYN